MDIPGVQGWMFGRDGDHYRACGWSAEVEDLNPNLSGAIWDALRLLGRRPRPASPGDITDSDLSAVSQASEDVFLAACRFYALERVLSYYRTQPSSGVGINNRIDFKGRADGLAEDLYGSDGKGGLKADLEDDLSSLGAGGAFVGEKITRNTIPPAHCIPRRY